MPKSKFSNLNRKETIIRNLATSERKSTASKNMGEYSSLPHTGLSKLCFMVEAKIVTLSCGAQVCRGNS